MIAAASYGDALVWTIGAVVGIAFVASLLLAIAIGTANGRADDRRARYRTTAKPSGTGASSPRRSAAPDLPGRS